MRHSDRRRSNRPRSKANLNLVILQRELPFAADPEPETVCFRGQTLAIVRHFFELSCQLGRLPSILGREFFRARVTYRGVPSFEEQVVFVHDVEHALLSLSGEEREILTMVGIYDIDYDDAAAMLRCSRGWISQRYSEALDRLTQIFLDRGLIKRDQPDRRQVQLASTKPANRIAPRKKPCDSVETECEGLTVTLC